MLQSPEEFSYAVQALFAAQAQALAAGRTGGGGGGLKEGDSQVMPCVGLV